MIGAMSISEVKEYLPFLIPLAILQISLMLAAVISVAKHDKFKVGTKPVWLLISLLVSIIGPILYFVIGKEDE